MDWSKGRVIYVHGSNNQAAEIELKLRWDRALFGKDMGERTAMAYYVDRARYPVPEGEDQAMAALLAEQRRVRSASRGAGSSRRPLPSQTRSYARAEVRALLKVSMKKSDAQLDADAEALADEELLVDAFMSMSRAKTRTRTQGGPSAKGIDDFLVVNLAKFIFPDAVDFLKNEAFRDKACASLQAQLAKVGQGPVVVISHSLGTMVAHEVFRRQSHSPAGSTVRIDHWFTLGSPLGLPAFQELMAKWAAGKKKLTFPDHVARWTNIADIADMAASWDPHLADDIDLPAARKGDLDELVEPRLNRTVGAHKVVGYLENQRVREKILPVVGGAAFRTELAGKHITADLSRSYIGLPDHVRVPVLLEVADNADLSSETLQKSRARIVDSVKRAVGTDKQDLQDACIDELKHYVAANLTERELREVVRSTAPDARTTSTSNALRRAWRNASKRALLTQSIHTVQAQTAHLGYGALGKKITWAVIDTGINASHPHFQKYANLGKNSPGWDCTKQGPAVPLPKKSKDPDGHGTHVAAIIGGEYAHKDGADDAEVIKGMAPQCGLVAFKALDDAGFGNDAWTIKAIEKIEAINEASGRLVIHGVNLSLGGNYERDAYGCGHTPVCTALRRLWRQGVVVVIAAGNEGTLDLIDRDGMDIQVSADLSIGDPANLEDAIAVGSVHKLNPHTYGVSHFSSRGPTADGRYKPDCVAPGERILSAKGSPDRGKRLDDLYIEMSGTSMAAPHVSGLLAAFLSARPEFIGEPDKVKKVLLANCTDLGRDRYFQGAGMPNLTKMLLAT